jgi:FAD/FMN-containing dehydrogenase
VRGQVLQPGDTAYDDARAVYNAMHARWPALVLRAGHADDVVAAVDFAREHGLQLAVRGGGHSIAGFGSCDDGLVLDHSRMSRVDVDSGRRIARAEAGCTWADFNDATHAFGLATTGGLISTTGIAGLTLGGGIGYLSRPCGLSCDNLVSADVVLANGERLTCSETTNSDLLWALRGGGGNFGVVTAFEFRIHPVNAVVAGPIFFPLSTEVVRAYREFMLGAPEQLGAVLGLTLAPPVPCLPPDRHGTPVAVVIICWPGEADDADAILRPLTQAAPAQHRSHAVPGGQHAVRFAAAAWPEALLEITFRARAH